MRSRLYVADQVLNDARRFGSARHYLPAEIIAVDGTRRPALFTKDQIHTAIARAQVNPEDIPPLGFWTRFWRRLFD